MANKETMDGANVILSQAEAANAAGDPGPKEYYAVAAVQYAEDNKADLEPWMIDQLNAVPQFLGVGPNLAVYNKQKLAPKNPLTEGLKAGGEELSTQAHTAIKDSLEGLTKGLGSTALKLAVAAAAIFAVWAIAKKKGAI